MAATLGNGNITFGDGTVQSNASIHSSIINGSTYLANTTYTQSVNTTRPILLHIQYVGNQGGNAAISVSFQWGLGSLTNTHTAINGVGVNYVVEPTPAIVTLLEPNGSNTIYWRVNTTNLSLMSLRVSLMQI